MEPKRLTSILPTVSRLPSLSPDPDVLNRIARLVLGEIGVGRGDEAKAAVHVAIDTASWYVMTKNYEMPMPEFRSIISGEKASLRTAIETLVTMLPVSSDRPPFAQMKNLFCSGDPAFLGDEETILEILPDAEANLRLEGIWQKEDEWDEAYSPNVVLPILKQWLYLLGELQHFLPPTKVPKDAERDFVASLLEFWRETLGLMAKNTRINGRQSGAFADFVRLAAEIIPQALRNDLGLPATFTLDACRHGGMTELEEAELTDGQGRALSGHRTKRAYEGYAKRTLERALPATRKRYAHAMANVQSTSVQNAPRVSVQNDVDSNDAAIA